MMRQLAFAIAILCAAASAAWAETAGDIAMLARDVDGAESVRAIKALDDAYVQYTQFGLWREAASLFAVRGEAIWGDDDVKGAAAIAAYLKGHEGAGRDGLTSGALNTRFQLAPVVTLSADRMSARARWHEFALRGKYGVSAEWAGGVLENDYVKENGVWKFKTRHYYPQIGGPYDSGWRNLEADLKIVPYHYDSANAGQPIPPPIGTPPPTKQTLASLSGRIAALNDEDKIRNLQAMYGYYLDRKMWDDVTDLFAQDGVLEIANQGVYAGPQGVRRALEQNGRAGLKHGQLFDHPEFDTMVQIALGGTLAHVRGIEWGMLGNANNGAADWSLAVFDNVFVKQDGVWRIREMRVFPLMKADYYQGWGKSQVVDPPPPAGLAPDKPAPAADRVVGAVPALLANPVTGKPVMLPKGMARAAGAGLLAPAAIRADPADFTMAEAQRRLAVSEAYDGVVNASAAFGYTIDDHRWAALVELFADKGAREEPFAGYYIGKDHIAAAEAAEWGPDPDPDAAHTPARTGIRMHLRFQPVIQVADDGRSATLMTRLIVWPSNRDGEGALDAGYYPGDKLVLENGQWKLFNVAIDEIYWSSAGYKGGWSQVKDIDPKVLANRRPNILLRVYPPDIPLTALGQREDGFIGGPGTPVEWPSIKPYWFSFKNPVSGRTPPLYWPDCASCLARPDMSLKANGY